LNIYEHVYGHVHKAPLNHPAPAGFGISSVRTIDKSGSSEFALTDLLAKFLRQVKK